MRKHLHIYIIALFTVVQLAVLMVFGYTPYPDSVGFEMLADESFSYGQPYPAREIMQEHPFIWNVGAVNLIELSLWIFGSSYPLLVVYAIVKGLSAWLLHTLAERLFNSKVALAALLLFVIYPANYDCTSFHSELPFTFFMLLGTLLALKRQPLMGGGALAVGAYIRPMGICFLVAICVFLLLNRHKYGLNKHEHRLNKHKHWLRNIAASIVGYAAVVMIIGTLTYHRTGAFIYQAKTGWMALMQYSWDNNPHQDADRTLFAHGDPMYADTLATNVIQRDSIWRRNFITWATHRPAEYLRQMPAKIVRTYASDNVNMCAFLDNKASRTYIYDDLDMESLIHDFPYSNAVQWATLLNLLYYYLLLAAFVAFLIATVRKRMFRATSLPFLIVFFCTGLLVTVGHGEARFHIPLMPYIIMGAAWIICRRHELRKQKSN